MLAFLRVKGFAIIDELDVEFKDGFNVITGETGAGKSIIINALSSLLNARAPTDVVRGAAEHAEIVGHCFQDGEEYILRRIIGSQGRSRAFVNDSPVTAKSLEELGSAAHPRVRPERVAAASQQGELRLHGRPLSRSGGGKAGPLRAGETPRRGEPAPGGEEVGRRRAGKEIDLLTYQLQEIEKERIGTARKRGSGRG